jgi:DNA-binding MarR family transcriptional regulator
MSRTPGPAGLPKRAAKTGQVCACFNIRKTARAITQLYDEELRPAGLRITQFAVLMAARGLESVTVSRLAKVGVMDRTTLTRNLRPLEKQGLIRIEPGEDRRERQVRLTARGQRALATAFPLWEKAQARVAAGFGQERLRRLFTELADLRAVGRAG